MRELLRRIPVVGGLFVRDIEPPTAWEGPESGRPVLIEEQDPELRSAMAAALRDAGFRTAECAGPGAHGEGRCPLVEGHGCDAVDRADAVVQVLVPSDEALNRVRAAIRAHNPELVVAVMAPAATVARRPDLVEGTTVSTGPLTRHGVVSAVQGAIGPPVEA